MLNLYFPPSFSLKSPPEQSFFFSNDTMVVSSAHEGSVPLLYDEDQKKEAYNAFYKHGGVMVTIQRPQSLGGRQGHKVIFKWNFSFKTNPIPWGGQMKVRIPSDLTEAPSLMRQTMSKSVMKLDPEQLHKDLALVEHAVRILSSAEAFDAARFEHHRAIGSHGVGLDVFVKDAVKTELDRHTDLDIQKTNEEKAARDLMSSLPDGTPIVIRSPHSNTWQLGVKKGRVDLSMARNSIIASKEILLGAELRAAGLSAHDALPLCAASAKAQASHPEATRFLANQPDLQPTMKLHKGQPFHKSLLTGKRAQTPAAWMETGSQFESRGLFSPVDEDYDRQIFWRSKKGYTSKNSLPLVRHAPHRALFLETKRLMPGRPELPEFGRVGGVWLVSAKVRDVFLAHNLGDAAVLPADLFDIEGVQYTGEWGYLAVNTPINAACPPQHDPAILTYAGGRPIQPFEVSVDTSLVEGLDFWWDDQVRHGAMFFSDRLYKALKRIKAMPRIAPKPCAAR